LKNFGPLAHPVAAVHGAYNDCLYLGAAVYKFLPRFIECKRGLAVRLAVRPADLDDVE